MKLEFTSFSSLIILHNKGLWRFEIGPDSCYNEPKNVKGELNMEQAAEKLKLAERGVILAISVYILLSAGKIVFGQMLGSSSLTADGFNNLSDIIANLAILIGLRMARKPADTDHRFGHWKMEDLASLVTSLIMFFVGLQVLLDTVQKIISGHTQEIDPLGIWVGIASALIIFIVYLYNRSLAKKVGSKALEAASKDNLSDAATSLGTSLAILASHFHLPILDPIIALVITLFILKTAYDIFIQATFSLSDGFDETLLKDYRKAIEELPLVNRVTSQRGRTYGSNVYLDMIIEMHPDLSVQESHQVTEEVEKILEEKFNVYDTDVHVEPAPLDQKEIEENLENRLYRYEMELIDQQHLEEHLYPHLIYIDQKGQKISYESLLQNGFIGTHGAVLAFHSQKLSQKSYMLTYQMDDCLHTSVWRRHINWKLHFHQITPIQK